jgi:Holliday junction DNA helicase RuvA
VGKKTAERIVLELKDKIAEEFNGGKAYKSPSAFSGNAGEAVLALVSLGYSKSEAASAVSKVGDKPGLSAQEIVILALKA